MIRNSRRVVALTVAGAVAIAPVISGCGAGSRPQSAAPSQLTEGVNASVPQGDATSQVDIRNMFLLGPRSDQMLPAGSSLPLYATIINQVEGRPDRLVSVTSPNFAPAQITGGAVTLPAAQPSGEGTPVTLVGQAPQAPQPGQPAQPGQTPQPGQTNQPSRTAQPGQATPTGRATATPSRRSPTPQAEATGPTSSPTPAPTAPGAAASDPANTATPTPPPGGATAQPSNEPVQPGGKAPLVVLPNLNIRQVLGGEAIRVRLQFEHAGSIEILVPVVPQQGDYTSYTAVSTGLPAPRSSPSQAAPGESPGGHD